MQFLVHLYQRNFDDIESDRLAKLQELFVIWPTYNDLQENQSGFMSSACTRVSYLASIELGLEFKISRCQPTSLD